MKNIKNNSVLFLLVLLSVTVCQFFTFAENSIDFFVATDVLASDYEPKPMNDYEPFPDDFFGDFSYPKMYAFGRKDPDTSFTDYPIPTDGVQFMSHAVPNAWLNGWYSSDFDTIVLNNNIFIEYPFLTSELNDIIEEYEYRYNYDYAPGGTPEEQQQWILVDEYKGNGINTFKHYTSEFNTYLAIHPEYKDVAHFDDLYYLDAINNLEGFDGLNPNTTFGQLFGYIVDWMSWNYNESKNWDVLAGHEFDAYVDGPLSFEMIDTSDFEGDPKNTGYSEAMQQYTNNTLNIYLSDGKFFADNRYWDTTEEGLIKLSKEPISSERYKVTQMGYGTALADVVYNFDDETKLSGDIYSRTIGFVNEMPSPTFVRGDSVYPDNKYYNGALDLGKCHELVSQVGYERIINPEPGYHKFTYDELFSQELFNSAIEYYSEFYHDFVFVPQEIDESGMIDYSDTDWCIKFFNAYLTTAINLSIEDRPVSIHAILTEWDILDDWNQSRYVNWVSPADFTIDNWQSLDVKYDYDTGEMIGEWKPLPMIDGVYQGSLFCDENDYISFDISLNETERTQGSETYTYTYKLSDGEIIDIGDGDDEIQPWEIILIMTSVVMGIVLIGLFVGALINKK